MSVMLSSTIMLLIGGFTLAGALKKYSIDRLIATSLLSLIGSNPAIVLLGYMVSDDDASTSHISDCSPKDCEHNCQHVYLQCCGTSSMLFINRAHTPYDRS